MKIIETERLILRTWKDSDLIPMSKINVDPDVMHFFSFWPNLEFTKEFIKKIKTQYDNYGYSFNAVEIKATKEFIGFVGLLNTDFESHFTPAVGLGWRLDSKHWNKGYATEAGKAVLDYGFTKLDLKEIVSYTAGIHKKMRYVIEKLGFSRNEQEDFELPRLDKIFPTCVHVLYRLTKENYLLQKE